MSRPENQAYAAYVLDCQHSSSACHGFGAGSDPVTTRYQGLAANYTVLGSSLDPASVNGMISDPAAFSIANHGGPSWYDSNLVSTGHVAVTPSGAVESHFDSFSPMFLNPLHFLFDYLPSLFINPKPGVNSGPGISRFRLCLPSARVPQWKRPKPPIQRCHRDRGVIGPYG